MAEKTISAAERTREWIHFVKTCKRSKTIEQVAKKLMMKSHAVAQRISLLKTAHKIIINPPLRRSHRNGIDWDKIGRIARAR